MNKENKQIKEHNLPKLPKVLRILGILFFVLSVTTFDFSAAYALDLDQAKKDGLVGERLDGFIAPVKSDASSEVQKFVEYINKERKEKYIEISKSTGQSVEVVEKLAGDKIKERLRSGEYYLDEKGQWVKK